VIEAQLLPTRGVRYALEIGINASALRVWQALTEEIDAWWLPDFHVAGADSTMTLDATPGGHLIERAADGGGILWYTVRACRPPMSLNLMGPLSVDCGPGVTMLTLLLEEREGGCVLAVADTLFGHITDALVDRLRGGWATLLSDGLKRHAEAAL
jgi:hypothetical protein